MIISKRNESSLLVLGRLMVSSFIKMAQNISRSFSAMQGTRPPTNSLSTSDSKSEKYFRILVHKQRIYPHTITSTSTLCWESKGFGISKIPVRISPNDNSHHAYTFGITWDAIVVDHLGGGSRESLNPKNWIHYPLWCFSRSRPAHQHHTIRHVLFHLKSGLPLFRSQTSSKIRTSRRFPVPSNVPCTVPLKSIFWVLKNIAVAK